MTRSVFLLPVLNDMSARSCYNITTGEGSIIVNISLIKNSDLPEAVNLLYNSFTSGYTMGDLITLFEPGKKTVFSDKKCRQHKKSIRDVS